MEQANVMNLCTLWLELLDQAGKYASRYYLARALEKRYGAQYYRALGTLAKTYKTEANLNKVIRDDLKVFPGKLLEILDAQTACGLPAFSDRRGYLDQIMMGFTMADRNGAKRRNHYRKQIDAVLRDLTKGPATALSLNQLENNFQQSLKAAA